MTPPPDDAALVQPAVIITKRDGQIHWDFDTRNLPEGEGEYRLYERAALLASLRAEVEGMMNRAPKDGDELCAAIENAALARVLAAIDGEGV